MDTGLVAVLVNGEDIVIECAYCGHRERNFETREQAEKAAAIHDSECELS